MSVSSNSQRVREAVAASDADAAGCAQETRHAIEDAAGEPVPADRFRGNLVAAGAATPFDEDTWATFHVGGGGGVGAAPPGGVAFESLKPCSRCSIPQIDQASGARGAQPARALRRLSTGAHLAARMPSAVPAEHAAAWARAVFFGWNISTCGSGVVRVGDAITVTRSRPRGSETAAAAAA